MRRLETDPTGRTVTRIVTELADGETVSFSADVVVVACGAVNSAALLLRSASDTHPDGLANRSGVVGRHYMRHNNAAVMAVSHEPNPTTFQKTHGRQRLVPRGRTTGTTRWVASRCSASRTTR